MSYSFQHKSYLIPKELPWYKSHLYVRTAVPTQYDVYKFLQLLIPVDFSREFWKLFSRSISTEEDLL